MFSLELQRKEERRNRMMGYIITAVFHALVLGWLFSLMLMPPDPPWDYNGGSELSISLGEPDMGGPDYVPVEMTEPEPIIDEQILEEEESIATQETEEAPELKTTPKPKEKTETPKAETKPVEKPIEKPVEKPRSVDQRALFKKNTQAAAGTGSGDGPIPGNEGDPNGSPDGSPDGNGVGNGTGGSGTGTGTGVGGGWGSYDLKGRSLKQRPQVVDNSRETGKVVVQIIVDRNGRVLKAIPGQKGTTTSSNVLWEKAKQGALDARFSARADGPDEQYGTMTFDFKFKP